MINFPAQPGNQKAASRNNYPREMNLSYLREKLAPPPPHPIKLAPEYHWILTKLAPFVLHTGQTAGGSPNSMSPQIGQR